MTAPHRAVPLTWLYVPGDRPDRFDRAAASGADVVIVDWEDAVAAEAKAAARANTVRWLAHRRSTVPVEVRVNGPATPWHDQDLAALHQCRGIASVRLAKTESAHDAVRVAERLPAGVALTCTIESAVGVERAFEIASAPGVARIGLGEADLAGELGAVESATLDWCRARIVVAARAAGLVPPAMSAYPAVDDLAGLAASCRSGARMGMLGRAAVHPRQLATIRESFLPGEQEVRRAREIIAALDAAADQGRGVTRVGGQMVDEAVVRAARRVVALADGDAAG